MSEPYVGEIRMFAGNFAPQGWAICNGQLLPIAGNETLFMLLGTTYGGDGENTFALPDLRGRIPVGSGSGYTLGQMDGTETVTLTTGQMPAHTHTAHSNSANGTVEQPANAFWAGSGIRPYGSGAPSIAMGAAITSAGGSLPHDNMMPFLTITFIIAMTGLYPTQN